MSYILDALKKIEHEKNKKARPEGRISITDDLFQERKQPASRGGIWKAVALIALAVLVLGAGSWFVLRGGARKGTQTQVVQQLMPSAPAPVAIPVIKPAMPAVPRTVPTAVAAKPVALKSSVPGAPVVRPSADNDVSAQPDDRSLKKQAMAVSAMTKQAAPTAPVPADIKLSGIAWQDERSVRRAVVNGFLLKEGAVVSGATITDILADKVRFSSAAGVFEIKLDSVLPGGGQR
jgi:general secretion pathway protein B